MVTNGAVREGFAATSTPCSADVKGPNIHDGLIQLETVLTDTDEMVSKILEFLMRTGMAKESDVPQSGAHDMMSHVSDINYRASCLHDGVYAISRVLGL